LLIEKYRSMKKIIVLFATIGIISSCKKKEEVNCFADNGGDKSLTIKLLKEGIPYTSTATAQAKAYVAFEQFDVPGYSDSSFDLVKVANDNNDFIRFYNLTCGIYYCKVRVIDPVSGTYSGSRIITIDAEAASAEASIDMTLQ
jgi:hypothetical protein